MIELLKKYKISNKKIVSFSDKKHPDIKYIANNRKQLDLYDFKIDGDLIKNDSINKCDFGVFIVNNNNLFLIELKGIDVNHAFKQLVETCGWFNIKAKSFNSCKKYIRVVCKSYDKRKRFTIEEYKKILKSKYHIREDDIIVKSSKLEENIS